MIISPGLRSAAAIVDPQLTGSLPVAALAAGLVEPLARVAVPAVGAAPLRFQDGVARGLAATILALGDELPDHPPDHLPDESWRVAAALASAQTHLSLIALGRPPAGHNLWPLATEVMRATGLSKSAALAALIPAWLRCLSSGILGRSWGTPDRVRQILGTEPAAARIRLDAWLRGLSLPTSLPAGVDVESVASRVLDPWQAAGLFLPGVGRGEIVAVLDAARSDESVPVSGSGPG
jgi:alcohol dehydrogenase YqhD (iron-dependent ADH family)